MNSDGVLSLSVRPPSKQTAIRHGRTSSGYLRPARGNHHRTASEVGIQGRPRPPATWTLCAWQKVSDHLDRDAHHRLPHRIRSTPRGKVSKAYRILCCDAFVSSSTVDVSGCIFRPRKYLEEFTPNLRSLARLAHHSPRIDHRLQILRTAGLSCPSNDEAWQGSPLRAYGRGRRSSRSTPSRRSC